MRRKPNIPLIQRRFDHLLQGQREPKGPHKHRTRLHLGYTELRDVLGRRSGKLLLVNRGKDYHSPAKPRFSERMGITANQRDIRGHGRNTSRVKRARRQALEALAACDGPSITEPLGARFALAAARLAGRAFR